MEGKIKQTYNVREPRQKVINSVINQSYNSLGRQAAKLRNQDQDALHHARKNQHTLILSINSDEGLNDESLGRTLGFFSAGRSQNMHHIPQKRAQESKQRHKQTQETLLSQSDKDKNSLPELNPVRSSEEFFNLKDQFNHYQQLVSGRDRRQQNLTFDQGPEVRQRSTQPLLFSPKQETYDSRVQKRASNVENNLLLQSFNHVPQQNNSHNIDQLKIVQGEESLKETKNEDFLMRNQRLKLIQTIKKRSSRKSNNLTFINDSNQFSPDSTHQFDTHPVTSRQSRRGKTFKTQTFNTNNQNSGKEQKIEKGEGKTVVVKTLTDILKSPAEPIKHKKKQVQEKQTQTGEHEQILEIKEFNLKKKLDTTAKSTDQKEIKIEDKLIGKHSLPFNEKLNLNSSKMHLYIDSLSKITNDVFDHSNQFFPDKLNAFAKTQFHRYIQGLKEVEDRLMRAIKEYYFLQVEEFRNFRDKVRKLTDDLQKTHQELEKERNENTEFLYGEKKKNSSKAIELLNSLNSLLQSDPIGKSDLNFGNRQGLKMVEEKNINNLSNKLNSIAEDIILEFDQIDKEKDSMQRKIKKAQLLMQLQPSSAISSLKEMHNMFIITNRLNGSTTPGTLIEDIFNADDPKQEQLLDEVENSIRSKFLNVQRDTAKKILNRFYKQTETQNKEVQTDEDFVKAKLHMKKARVKYQKEEIKTLNQKLGGLEDEYKEKTREFQRLSQNLEELQYMHTHLKRKYEEASNNEYQFRKKYADLDEKFKFLEEDVEQMEIKRREAEKIRKQKEEELKKTLEKVTELEKQNSLVEQQYQEKMHKLNETIKDVTKKLENQTNTVKSLEKKVKGQEEQMKLLLRSPSSSAYDGSDVSYSDGYDPNDPASVKRHKEKAKQRLGDAYYQKKHGAGYGPSGTDDESNYTQFGGKYGSGSRQTDYSKYGKNYNSRKNRKFGDGSRIGEDGEYSDESSDGDGSVRSGKKGKKGKHGLRSKFGGGDNLSLLGVNDPNHPLFGKAGGGISGDEGSPRKNLLNQEFLSPDQWGGDDARSGRKGGQGHGGQFSGQDSFNAKNQHNKLGSTQYANQKYSFMEPLKKGIKQALLEQEWKEHQAVHDRCGPNCKWMQRMGRVFIRKNNRQELKMNKQSIKLDGDNNNNM